MIIQNFLKQTYRKYTGKSPTDNSQLCLLWSTNNPPDVLEDTAPMEEIMNFLGMYIEEDKCMELFDMSIIEGSKYLKQICDKNKRI